MNKAVELKPCPAEGMITDGWTAEQICQQLQILAEDAPQSILAQVCISAIKYINANNTRASLGAIIAKIEAEKPECHYAGDFHLSPDEKDENLIFKGENKMADRIISIIREEWGK